MAIAWAAINISRLPRLLPAASCFALPVSEGFSASPGENLDFGEERLERTA